MNRSAIVNNNRIEISFPFDLQIIETVKTIPNREWKPKDRVWTVPNLPWHCAKVLETLAPLGFYIDPTIEQNADGKLPAPKIKLPDSLYGYQKEGVRFIHQAGGRAIVADEMGLGKTAEALVYVDKVVQGRTLIVAPANVLFKWALKEVPAWTMGKTVQVVTTGKQPVEDRDITIMSYGIMVSKYEELKTIPFDCVIFDEAHAVKNYKAQRTRVAKQLVKGVPYLLFLSGTPFMNRRMELYSLLNMLDPKSWPNGIQFGIRYCNGVFQRGHWIRPPDGETNTAELKDRLSRIMLRRTKKEVANELPELTRVSIPIEIENRREYEQEFRDVRKNAAKHKKISGAVALGLLARLRKLVGEGKIKPAIELAEDVLEGGNQVVLFAHHLDVVEQLRVALSSYGVGIISGDVPAQERQQKVDAFLSGKLRVMLVTLAGAEGIDLYSASNLIFVEREWTPAREEQIEARLHRTGQKNPVTAYYLVAKNTIDDRLDELVRSKRGEFGRLVDVDVVKEIWLSEFGSENE